MANNMEIRQLFLFSNYKIIIFNALSETTNYAIRYGGLCYGYGTSIKYGATEFDNARIRIKPTEHQMLGRLSEITEEKCLKVFKEARYQGKKYPDFTNPDGEKLESALESIKSYFKAEGWNHKDSYSWVIIPRPAKKLVGKKVEIKFNIVNEDFDKHIEVLLPVYYNNITAETKEVKYSIEIPDYLYDFINEDPDVEQRPKSKVYTTTVFSDLQTYLSSINLQAGNIKSIDERLAKAEKVLCVKFISSQREMRDSYQFGYAGNKTSIVFQFYVAYKMYTGSIVEKQTYFVDKRYEQGKGYVNVRGRFMKLSDQLEDVKVIPWTEEREKYLTELETKFKELSINLNNFIGNMNAEKLDFLIENKSAKNLLTE